jgi:hypothetical protein
MQGDGGETVTDLGTSTVSPNWYPDNDDPRLQRWWDGYRWTEHVAPRIAVQPVAAQAVFAQAAAAQAAGYSPNPTYGYSIPAAMPGTVSFVNSLASRALIFSLISIVINPLLLVSVSGIVMGIVALVRAPGFAVQQARRGSAIAAIIVGLVAITIDIGAGVFVYQLQHPTVAAVSQPQVQQPQAQPRTDSQITPTLESTTAQLTDVQASILRALLSRGASGTPTISCPPATVALTQRTFDCIATLSDGSTRKFAVNLENGTGYGISWSLADTLP